MDDHARITFDPSADAFHGRVIGMRDVIDFYGRTPEELREEFKTSVDEYLAWCAAVVAAQTGDSVNAWIGKLLDRETRRALEEADVPSV